MDFGIDVGIYIWKPPLNKKNVVLVLGIDNRLASPQFHIHFYPYIRNLYDIDKTTHWKTTFGFIWNTIQLISAQYESNHKQTDVVEITLLLSKWRKISK